MGRKNTHTHTHLGPFCRMGGNINIQGLRDEQGITNSDFPLSTCIDVLCYLKVWTGEEVVNDQTAAVPSRTVSMTWGEVCDVEVRTPTHHSKVCNRSVLG